MTIKERLALVARLPMLLAGGGERPAPRRRNWLFKGALVVASVALAVFGIVAWSTLANAGQLWTLTFQWLAGRPIALDVAAQAFAALDPLWMLYATGAVFCVAAQFIAAAGAVNARRILDDAHAENRKAVEDGWLWLSVTFYVIAAAFAAYSADQGARMVLDRDTYEAYVAREDDRALYRNRVAELDREMASLRQTIANANETLSEIDPTQTVAARQRTAGVNYDRLVSQANTRLPLAQDEREKAEQWLVANPRLPRVKEAGAVGVVVFLAFLFWALLEPWGYALAERGTEARVKARAERPKDKPSPSRKKEPEATRTAHPEHAGADVVDLRVSSRRTVAAPPAPAPATARGKSPPRLDAPLNFGKGNTP